MMRKSFMLFLLLVLSGNFCQAQPLLDIEVRAGFDEVYKQGEWMPITTIIRNSGPAIEGILSVELEDASRNITTFSRPVSLPSRSQKKETLYILMGEFRRNLTLRLISGRKEVWKKEVDLRPVYEADYLVLFLSQKRVGLEFLSGMKSPSGQGRVKLVYGRMEEFPERWKGLGGIDLIVFGDISPDEFNKEQKQALEEWTVSGGTLVVIGGAGSGVIRKSFIEEILPVKIRGVKKVTSLSSLENYYGEKFTSPQETVIADCVLKDGIALVSQDEMPLISKRELGSGNVIFMSFDPDLPPMRGWDGSRVIWERIITGRTIPLMAQNVPWQIAQQVHQMRATEPPSFKLIGLFLLLYIALLGPANYFVLKRMGKRELSWVTMPIIVLAFSFSAYFIGYSMKGGDILTNEISVMDAHAESGIAKMDTYLGIFSPSKTSYNISFRDTSAFASEFAPQPMWQRGSQGGRKFLQFWEEEEITLKDVNFNMWSMRVFKVESLIKAKPSIRYSISGDSVKGEIVTGAPYDLDKAFLIWNENLVQDLGRIGRKCGFQFKLPKGRGSSQLAGHASSAFSSASPQQHQLIQNVLTEWYHRRGQPKGLMLVGASPTPSLTVNLGKRIAKRQAMSIYILHLPVEFEEDVVKVPLGGCEGKIVEFTGQPSAFYYGDQSQFNFRGGYMVIEFNLPFTSPDIVPDYLEVAFSYQIGEGGRMRGTPQPGEGDVILSIYNWRSSSWDELKILPSQRIENAQPYCLLPEGLVRIKAEAKGNTEIWEPKVDIGFMGRKNTEGTDGELITRDNNIQAAFAFTDIARSVGVANTGSGNGCASGDYDNDGDLDIYVVNDPGYSTLYRNEGNGSFSEVGYITGVTNTNGQRAAFADYNNDGYLDIYLTRQYGDHALYRNNGDGTFTDVASSSGVCGTQGQGTVSWGDYNNDGQVDILLGGIVTLYQNNGDGTFTDVTSTAALTGASGSHASFGDYDSDADLDIYTGSEVYRNNGDATFSDVTSTTGIGTSGSVRFAWGDYDNDGDLDIYLTRETRDSSLYRNNGDGTFTDVASSAGVSLTVAHLTPTIDDFDNDGDLDIFILGTRYNGYNTLYSNNGDGTFTDITFETGVAGGSEDPHSMATGDYDNDGNLDIYIVNFTGYGSSANRIYRNNGTSNNYLIIKTVGTQSNKDGIGAKVRVVTGTKSQTRYVGINNTDSQNSLPVEFGLGNYTRADVEVTWPGGTVQTLTNLSANQIKSIEEPPPLPKSDPAMGSY